MKPKAVPKHPQKPYAVSFEVLRGKRQEFNSEDRRYFVQNIKGVVQAVSAEQGKRKIDRIEKTLSIPIMIDNPNVNGNIYRDINDAMLKEIKRIYK